MSTTLDSISSRRTRSGYTVALPLFVAVVVGVGGAGGAFAWRRAHAQREPSPPVTAAAEDSESAIRRAALERFGASVAKLVIDGKEITPDESVATDIKVDIFKKSLARRAQERDPAFRAKAESELRLRQPVVVTITWDDLSGSEQLEFDMKDSRSCPDLVGTARDVSAKDIAKLPCLRVPVLQNRWDDGAALHATFPRLDEGDPKWEKMVAGVMVELAADSFAANARP